MNPLLGTVLNWTAILKKKQYEIVGNKLNTKLKALQPQTKYKIRVCSINAIGRSVWTEWMHVETKVRINEIPLTPYIVDTKVLNNKSFHVSWSMDHQKSSSPGGGSRRKRKPNSMSNTNSTNSRSTAAGIDSSLLFHVYVDCDDGRMFHQVHECQSIMNATIHGIASTTGSVKCRVQTSHAVSHQRSPFSPTVHVQMFSLKARQRKKQQEAGLKAEQNFRKNRSSSSGDSDNSNDSKQKHKSMDKKAAQVALQKKIFWSKLKKKINTYGPMVVVFLSFLLLIGLSFDKKVIVPKKVAVEPRATTEMAPAAAAVAAEVAAEAVAPAAVVTPAAVSTEKTLSSLQEKARKNAERLTAPVASATVLPDVVDESRTTKADEPSFV